MIIREAEDGQRGIDLSNMEVAQLPTYGVLLGEAMTAGAAMACPNGTDMMYLRVQLPGEECVKARTANELYARLREIRG